MIRRIATAPVTIAASPAKGHHPSTSAVRKLASASGSIRGELPLGAGFGMGAEG